MNLKVITMKIKIHPAVTLTTNQLIHNYYLNFKN